MSIPVFTTIVPIYNTQKYLNDCISRILKNSNADLEVILVDDGSSDSSLDIMNYYVKQDNRIKVVSIKHSGTAVARNIGLNLARGKYISFIDSDDFVSENLYAKLKKIIEKNSPDIVMFNAGFYDQKKKTLLNETFFKIKTIRNHTNELSKHTYKDFNQLFYIGDSACNKIYKKSFLEKNKLKFIENSTFEDRLFSFPAILKAENISILNERLYIYRIKRENSTYESLKNKNNKKVFNVFNELKYLDEVILENYKDVKSQYFDYISQILIYYLYKTDRRHRKEFYYEIQNKFIEMSNWGINKLELEKYPNYENYMQILNNNYFEYKIKRTLKKLFNCTII